MSVPDLIPPAIIVSYMFNIYYGKIFFKAIFLLASIVFMINCNHDILFNLIKKTHVFVIYLLLVILWL